MVHRDAVIIMLKGVSSLEAVRPNRGKGQDTEWDAYIWVKDADALYEEFRAKGAQVARTIENQPYGCRDFDILDNSGYTLCFGQDMEG